MIEITKGMLAKSKAGHDKDRIYMIIDFDDTFVYLVDGKIRTLDRPKKKKWHHIQVIKVSHETTGINNEGVKRVIRLYNKKED